MENAHFENPAHSVFEVNGLLFSSNFDSGNLMKVERGAGANEYLLWTAPDNAGTDLARADGTNAWFYFCVSRAKKETTLRLQIMNAANHSGLYKQDMRPVYRCSSSGNAWARLKSPVKFQRQTEKSATLNFEYTMEADDEVVYFAFTYPYGYNEVQKELDDLEARYGTEVDMSKPDGIYFRREVITLTPDGRKVDLLTISSTDGAGDKNEVALSGLFPEFPGKSRPPSFPEKEVVFVSARVHPGEVPAQHTFKGILDMLLDKKDLRSKELRKRFVFKLIPLLNPDGVYRGHFRMDQYGNNLNRYYLNPDKQTHPAIFAAKSLLDYYSSEGRLSMYLDLHSHASKRGCFIYGNVMDTVIEQTQNQLFCYLIALNSPHFDYSACLFSREHMTRIDPGDSKKGLTAEGSGRVATYLAHGIIHSYTLECNYNTSRVNNDVPAPVVNPEGDISDNPMSVSSATHPEKYTPASYHNVGRACIVAMLDIRDINPCSRIPNSRHLTLDKIRAVVGKEVGLRKEYRMSRMKQRSLSVPRQKKAVDTPSNPDEFTSVPWRRCVSALPSQSGAKWSMCDESGRENIKESSGAVVAVASVIDGVASLSSADTFIVYNKSLNSQPASPSKGSPTISKSKSTRERSQKPSSDLEIRGDSLFRVQPVVSVTSPIKEARKQFVSITYTDALSKDIDDIISKAVCLTSNGVTPRPPEAPPAATFDATTTVKTFHTSSSSKLSQAAKAVLRNDTSRPSPSFFVNQSPADGGRSLSATISAGTIEDVSRFTQPLPATSAYNAESLVSNQKSIKQYVV